MAKFLGQTSAARDQLAKYLRQSPEASGTYTEVELERLLDSMAEPLNETGSVTEHGVVIPQKDSR